MFEQATIQHHIQRSIVSVLTKQEFARFRDLKPTNVDTNLFSYHLKLLQKAGFIAKTEQGYTLAEKGLQYVDRANTTEMKLRSQPKIITMLLIQDGYGKVLLQKRAKQPYINTWTLPYGKMHIDDESVLAAARRESQEKLGFDPHKMRHVGECYIVVGRSIKVATEAPSAGTFTDGDTVPVHTKHMLQIESRTLAHIVRFETDAIAASDTLQWVEPLNLPKLKLAPAVEEIVSRSFFGDEFFFEEFLVSNSQ
ncbi:MAG: NUDIX hydrolase [Candidatus Saccharibacteria bacterium]|nr:NUDIX hydrolase [Candidatus Saccharibacteria bacterium]MCA9340363.1 NUDIX hydrolase [Candidatus Saccharibacteria bacterium]HPQ82626.1 NUDIX hydrolase [Candidatus Saccharimonas sp.]